MSSCRTVVDDHDLARLVFEREQRADAVDDGERLVVRRRDDRDKRRRREPGDERKVAGVPPPLVSPEQTSSHARHRKLRHVIGHEIGGHHHGEDGERRREAHREAFASQSICRASSPGRSSRVARASSSARPAASMVRSERAALHRDGPRVVEMAREAGGGVTIGVAMQRRCRHRPHGGLTVFERGDGERHRRVIDADAR